MGSSGISVVDPQIWGLRTKILNESKNRSLGNPVNFPSYGREFEKKQANAMTAFACCNLADQKLA
jgi:hypothetical protein